MFKKIFLIIAVVVLSIVIVYTVYNVFLGNIFDVKKEPSTFIISQNSSLEEIISLLEREKIISNEVLFRICLFLSGNFKISSGAYKISPPFSILKVISVLKKGPYMKWVTIPEGLRKEEIADILAKELNWDENKKNQFLTAYQMFRDNNYQEGVYFPDIYLLPLEEDGYQIAKRFINHFNEVFAPYLEESLKQNIKWTTLLKIASLVQREAFSKEDMPLVAGIIWNRLLKGMKLEIDATVQYARGNKGRGFWTPLEKNDFQIDSPYNTYLYKGLPPSPISNPGLLAIKAALFPETTTCLFYLHDKNGKIHCSDSYDKHRQNIEKYL